MELRYFAQNEIIAAEDYIDNSDEHHPERIACHAQATFYDNFTQTGKLIIKQVAVGERPMPTNYWRNIALSGIIYCYYARDVTLSPLLCELAAQALIYKKAEPLLTPYRVSRFS